MPCKPRLDIGLICQLHRIWLESMFPGMCIAREQMNKTAGNKAKTTNSVNYKLTNGFHATAGSFSPSCIFLPLDKSPAESLETSREKEILSSFFLT